jgi:sRNA-binding carbon storage regulator CsrA
MLVISRKKRERVRIAVPDGPVIWVTLCDSRRNDRAQLGFEAPRGVQIDREELLDEGPIETAWGAVP